MSDAASSHDNELPLSDFGKRLEKAVTHLTGRTKYGGMNAFNHLRLSWQIKDIDQGMAAFRAITAEEEAATALIHSIKQKRYPNADEAGFKDFQDELMALSSERGCERIKKHIESEANLRNRILYASERGIPKVNIPDGFILTRKDRVLAILSIMLMVEQSNTHQAFVVQCLSALLKALPRVADTSIQPDEPASKKSNPKLIIYNSPELVVADVEKDGVKHTALTQFTCTYTFSYKWLNTWTV